jgi:dTDP-4-dehydrorhamnose reductase
MKKKILLTGSKGFILSSFYERYKNEYEIIRTGRKNKDIVNLDVRDESQVNRVVKQYKPEIVLHGAGITSTAGCENNKTLAYDVNVNGTINIAKACKNTGARMIFFSTEQVFNGNEKTGPYTEWDSPMPNTYYGETKLAGENQIKSILDDYVIMRLTWMYGFSEDPAVKNILTDTIFANEDIKVPDNEFRGMSPIETLLDVLPKIMNLPKGIYHVGSENDKSRYAIVKEILQITNKNDVQLIRNNHDQVRDIRLSTKTIHGLGIEFDETSEAIKKTITKHKDKIEEIIKNH